MVAIPRRRFLPPALGIIRSRTGSGRKLRSFNAARSWSRNPSTPAVAVMDSAVCPSTPAVLAPLFARTRAHATRRNAGSATRLNRSSNRRPGSATAQRCSLAWISSTRGSAQPRAASSSLIFTSVLLVFQHPEPRDLLAPLAMCRAFPGSDYYGASVPSRGRQPATGLPCHHPDRVSGARAAGDGSHIHRATDRRGRRPADAPAASPRLRRSTSPWPPPRSLEVGFGVGRRRDEDDGHALHPGPHPPGWSRYHVYEALTLVPLVRLLISLAGPAPSGSTDASRHRRGCSHPSRHPPGQAAPCFIRLLRPADGAGLSPPPGYSAPRGP